MDKRIKPKSPQGWRNQSVRNHVPKKNNSKKRTKKNSRSWLKRIISIGIIGALCALIIAFISIAWFSRDLPEPGGEIKRDTPISTKIYDRTGETVLFEFFSDEKRTPVQLEALPRYVKWAVITTEDRNFYSHSGFDIKGFARALIRNILGRDRSGGSTITQQLIKNALLTNEKTITRKIKELVLAWQLEQKFTKDEILELYLNEIPYGSVTYGIEAASQSFFSKPAKDLSVAQAALLAAIPQAPSRYSPYGPNQDLLFGRQQWIIKSMADLGYITQEEADEALAEEIEFSPGNTSIVAPHFVFYVRELLAEKYGEYTIEQGGLRVITTLDLYKQNIAQEIIDERGEINQANYGASNAAMVSLNPKTGEILTMIGSRDFFNQDIDGEVNVALRPRQPGSSFKPLVFAAAFEKGLSPDTVLFDLDTTFATDIPGEDYKPKNYNLDQNGPVTIRQALGSSLNTPAVKTIYLTGIETVLNLVDKLGYTTLGDRSRFGLSLVLGGAEVKLLEHVAAYGAFARDGLYHKPVAILRIEDSEGRVLEEFKPENTPSQQVLDSQVVRQINSILTDNEARLLTFQENNYLHFADRPVAAKTGTTNDYRDAWTIGYTPSLVTGVWVGNNDNTTMKGRAAGGALAAPIWREFMNQVLGDTPVETFKAPEDSPLPNKPMLNGNYSFENRVKIDKTTGKLATDYTPQINIVEQVYSEVHNILHYVNKNNILGPIPETPWDDKNYTNWELPVEAWAKEKGIIIGTPPTDFDDVHRAEDQPEIEINSPLNSTVSSNNITVSVSGEAPRGVQRIEYYLDNNLVGTELLNGVTISNNYIAQLSLPNIFSNGDHLLKVVIYDDLNNDAEDATNINLQIPNNPIKNNVVEFISPTQNSSINANNLPYTISVKITAPGEVRKIDFYWLSKLDNSSQLITSTTEIDESVSISLEEVPKKGSYELYTITTDTNGRLTLDNSVSVTIQ